MKVYFYYYLKTMLSDFSLKAVGAFLLGNFLYLTGSVSIGMQSLVILLMLDLITGVCLAAKKNELESKKLRWGLAKFFLYAVAIIMGNQIDLAVFGTGEIEEFMSTKYYIVLYLVLTEGISVSENLEGLGVPLPLGLIRKLKTYQNSLSKKE